MMAKPIENWKYRNMILLQQFQQNIPFVLLLCLKYDGFGSSPIFFIIKGLEVKKLKINVILLVFKFGSY
jgi:hypothetical protein